MTGRAVVIRGDARRLPLPDASVDLIVTSPPYYALRSYTDGGQHYSGQIGDEPTPGEYIANLINCTREWVRVLKPTGSIFCNLADKYGPQKTLLGLPWRYALGCMDELGLILRRDQIWDKPNPLPESVTDRCASQHEYWFHLVKQPRYYSAVDEIREPHVDPNDTRHLRGGRRSINPDGSSRGGNTSTTNPLGKLPGSVWRIATEPLTIPDHISHARCCDGRKRAGCSDGIDHFAAFPTEWPRRIISGWSPPGICTACGEGRRPAVDRTPMQWRESPTIAGRSNGGSRKPASGTMLAPAEARITGYVCACTPYTDHPGTGGSSGPRDIEGHYSSASFGGGNGSQLSTRPRVGPWREYHFDQWTPAPTRPAVVLDPFGGTGTTALVASVLGRVGISVDKSWDYGATIARWRTTDRGQIAKVMGVPKPPPVPASQTEMDLFGGDARMNRRTRPARPAHP